MAVGKLKELSAFAGDYPAPDGTRVHDYIHLVDLAKGHLKALERIQRKENVDGSRIGAHIWNLGTGSSVLQVIKVCELASGTKIPNLIKNRRLGDIASY